MVNRKTGGKSREGEKRQLLVYLPVEVITALKIAGIEDGTSVSRIVEEIAASWLKRRQARIDRKKTVRLGRGIED